MKKYYIILAGLIIAEGLWIILPPLFYGDKQEAEPSKPPVVEQEEAVSS